MRVMLDTCVLYPAVLRDFLLALAARGLFVPLWSDGVAAEWLHLVARRNPAEIADVKRLLMRMAARWPESRVTPGAPEMLDLPDPADRHVLAAAIAGCADLILTDNWRDFPRPVLAAHGQRAVKPDDFVVQLWLEAPQIVAAEVAAHWPGRAGRDLRRALRKAGLPRLGKALEH
jgi:predicted nucleic acid-binding protein